MSSPQQLVQKLWNYCNILRDDGLSYGDYVEQLTYLLFLKMADEQADHDVTSPMPSLKSERVAFERVWLDARRDEGDHRSIERHVHMNRTRIACYLVIGIGLLTGGCRSPRISPAPQSEPSSKQTLGSKENAGKTVQRVETNRFGFSRITTELYFDGSLQYEEIMETFPAAAALDMPGMNRLGEKRLLASLETYVVEYVTSTSTIDGVKITTVERFHRFRSKPFPDRVSTATYADGVLVNEKHFYPSGKLKRNCHFRGNPTRTAHCIDLREDGTKERETHTRFRADGTPESERETSYNENGNATSTKVRTYDADGRLISEE